MTQSTLFQVKDEAQLCISLWHPWAMLWAIGEKICETRSWPFPPQYRGQTILIHAAKKWDGELADYCRFPTFCAAFLRHLDRVGKDTYTEYDLIYRLIETGAQIGNKPIEIKLPFGAIIGSVRFVKSVRMSSMGAFDPQIGLQPERAHIEDSFGDFSAGRFAWVGADHRIFDKPIPYRGHQGFFNVAVDSLSLR